MITLLCFTIHSKAQEKSIILGRPTDTSITASILFNQAVTYYLEYGTQSGSYPNATAIYTNTADVPDEVEVTGLAPNTQYYYRMQYKVGTATNYTPTAEYKFHTQRAPGSSFAFTVEADEHLYNNYADAGMYQVTLANEAAENPDFMLSLGDIFGDDHTPTTTTSADMNVLHKNYRQYLGQLCHSVPFYVCLGNHDAENDYYLNVNGIYTTATNNLPAAPNAIGVWGTLWRKYYYPNPFPNSFYSGNSNAEGFGMDLPENYYAWTWGDALFVVLDVYRTEIFPGTAPVDGSKPLNWEWTLGYTQYQWMRNVLETSTATHKFVFAHHTRGQGRGGISTATGNEWGGMQGNQYKFDQYRPGWGKPIHQVFVDAGVDIFFQGHDHLFAKEQLNGVVYQEVPMPSDATYTFGYTANATAYTDVTLDGTGHIKVNVTPNCVTVDYVKSYIPGTTGSTGHTNGEIGYSYTVGTCNLNTDGVGDPKAKVWVYPNPANAKLYISFEDNSTNHHYQITNILGQIITTFDTNECNTEAIPNGIYFLEIDGNKNLTKKIIIKHFR
ncbi:T9SS type A sorting domain-containing protein [Flavobacterium sp. N1994]|uniref:T9SS type A sorting domain-containing protein n=1 Tax=Flavobacterium sp. N1994 TaxID=2986827 RepID=UPI002222A3E6|nr:T9SS type A sorting domain-containing protein [Flavobacterium sp. N1994]